jgi:transcriptional regulator with GAF, ATPase, and Fis domain
VERLLVLHPGETEILPEHLVGILSPTNASEPDMLGDLDGLGLEEATVRLERRLIQRALERANGVQSKAAELLHTTRRILKYKMDQLDIDK